tara:strand:+ start:320 stop:829 length:510 start_codon:yes stop_codon:yes gene_type:complete
MISLIAAIDEKNGLGYKNQLLCHLPADLKYFKEQTLNKPIIMGRLTFESIGRPLPNRKNIVISRSMTSEKDVIVVDSIDHALRLAGSAPEVMIIGGASIYDATISCAEQLYITVIHHLFEADVFFPKIDPKIWQLESSQLHPADEFNKYALSFIKYKKKQCVRNNQYKT